MATPPATISTAWSDSGAQRALLSSRMEAGASTALTLHLLVAMPDELLALAVLAFFLRLLVIHDFPSIKCSANRDVPDARANTDKRWSLLTS
jgi:hypothetical protein